MIRTGREKILTVEDPVEYELAGVPQVPVNEKVGVTFAGALRALLRQDPDIILVGEIRDAETAQIATQAALTGHLVLSTLHTNDAPTALTRLLDLDVAAYLVASTVDAVLAQRLVRVICPNCKTETRPDKAAARRIDVEALGLHARVEGSRVRGVPRHRVSRTHRRVRAAGDGQRAAARGAATPRVGGAARDGDRQGHAYAARRRRPRRPRGRHDDRRGAARRARLSATAGPGRPPRSVSTTAVCPKRVRRRAGRHIPLPYVRADRQIASDGFAGSSRPHRPRGQRSRTLLLASLLACTLVLATMLAYEAHDAARSHRATAERALHDYAAVAAWELVAGVNDELQSTLGAALAPITRARATSPYELLPGAERARPSSADSVLRCPTPARTRRDSTSASTFATDRSRRRARPSRPRCARGSPIRSQRTCAPSTSPTGTTRSSSAARPASAPIAIAYSVKYAEHSAPIAAYGIRDLRRRRRRADDSRRRRAARACCPRR